MEKYTEFIEEYNIISNKILDFLRKEDDDGLYLDYVEWYLDKHSDTLDIIKQGIQNNNSTMIKVVDIYIRKMKLLAISSSFESTDVDYKDLEQVSNLITTITSEYEVLVKFSGKEVTND